jgi:hypothetical protein
MSKTAATAYGFTTHALDVLQHHHLPSSTRCSSSMQRKAMIWLIDKAVVLSCGFLGFRHRDVTIASVALRADADPFLGMTMAMIWPCLGKIPKKLKKPEPRTLPSELGPGAGSIGKNTKKIEKTQKKKQLLNLV